MTGRVIIDPFGFNKFNPVSVIRVEKFESDVGNTGDSDKGKHASEHRFPTRLSLEEQKVNKSRMEANRCALSLMSPMLPGYSLRLRKWGT